MTLKTLLAILLAACTLQAQADDTTPQADPNDPTIEVARMRFCQRVRDHALQALYDRDKDRPMKQFDDDGSDGLWITNTIIKRIYTSPEISSPKRVEAFARATCNDLLMRGRPD